MSVSTICSWVGMMEKWMQLGFCCRSIFHPFSSMRSATTSVSHPESLFKDATEGGRGKANGGGVDREGKGQGRENEVRGHKQRARKLLTRSSPLP